MEARELSKTIIEPMLHDDSNLRSWFPKTEMMEPDEIGKLIKIGFMEKIHKDLAPWWETGIFFHPFLKKLSITIEKGCIAVWCQEAEDDYTEVVIHKCKFSLCNLEDIYTWLGKSDLFKQK